MNFLNRDAKNPVWPMWNDHIVPHISRPAFHLPKWNLKIKINLNQHRPDRDVYTKPKAKRYDPYGRRTAPRGPTPRPPARMAVLNDLPRSNVRPHPPATVHYAPKEPRTPAQVPVRGILRNRNHPANPPPYGQPVIQVYRATGLEPVGSPAPRENPHARAPVNSPNNEKHRHRHGIRPEIHINPILALPHASIAFDVRYPLPEAPIFPMSSPYYGQKMNFREIPLTSSPCRVVRIVSKHFPWTFDLRSERSKAWTCYDALRMLHVGLQDRLEVELWMSAGERKQSEILRASGRRSRREGGHCGDPLRVDWLGEEYIFRGLERDDGLARARLYPGDALVPETWAAVFTRRRS
ncbi:hypothetical protein PLICRDRAFT_172697 [Plicaturopsis crispa FD-325 SS-3]|nr:hypothetical protein PLICRDRAFT_172697 [Plicaturopsis crispa FD-325 SS-3]